MLHSKFQKLCFVFNVERVVYQNYYADNSNSNGQSPKQKAPQKRLPLPAQAMQPPLRSPVAMKTLYDNAIPGSSVYSTVDSSPYCTIDSSVYSTAGESLMRSEKKFKLFENVVIF